MDSKTIQNIAAIITTGGVLCCGVFWLSCTYSEAKAAREGVGEVKVLVKESSSEINGRLDKHEAILLDHEKRLLRGESK